MALRSRIFKKFKIVSLCLFLVTGILMEIYDIVIDSMEAKEYKAGNALHLTKPNPIAAIAFISLASIGAVFSVLKICFSVVCFIRLIHNVKEENEVVEMAKNRQSNQEKDYEVRLSFLNVVIKGSTLIFEDLEQAVMSYWFVTRCSVVFNSVLKISFICVCPLLNFAYFTFIIIRFAVKYRGKNKGMFRCIAGALFFINIIPLVFGVLSSIVAFDRTNLVGDVPEIVLVERATFANQRRFSEINQTNMVGQKSLYQVWKILDSDQSNPRNIFIPCKNGTFFENKIFDGCAVVEFQFYYEQMESAIVYRIRSCKEFPETCFPVSLNQTFLSLEFSTDFCGKNKLKPK